MIIWSGYGFVVAVIVFLVALAGNVGFDAAFGKGYYENHWWTIGAALIVSAVIILPFAIWLRAKNERVVIDKETGEELSINRNDHSLFFIPLWYWSPLLAVIGIGLCVYELVA